MPTRVLATVLGHEITEWVDGVWAKVVTPNMKDVRSLLGMMFEDQRDLIEKHCIILTDEMKANRFLPGTDVIVCLWGSRIIVVDGNHKLNAIVRSGKLQAVTLKVYKCDTFEEVGVIYACLDASYKRSSAVRSRAIGADKILGAGWTNDTFPSHHTAHVIAALRYIHVGFNKRMGEIFDVPETQKAVLDLYRDSAQAYLGLVTEITGGSKTESRAKYYWALQILPVALYSIQKDATFALPFWTKVLGPTQTAGTPAHMIVDWFIKEAQAIEKERRAGRTVRKDVLAGISVAVTCYKLAKANRKAGHRVLLNAADYTDSILAGAEIWQELNRVIKGDLKDYPREHTRKAVAARARAAQEQNSKKK